MDKLPALGRSVQDIIKPTLATFEPLLLDNADQIRSIPKHTFSYGPHDRQKLDVYAAAGPSLRHGRHPVLMFLYGGGFTQGDRTLAGYAGGLCHANIAAFFALQHGYTTIIVDYRLVNVHDAKFPSGGDDVALAVDWILKHSNDVSAEPVDLFIMGNSAGGIHLSTFLLHPLFSKNRKEALDHVQVSLRGVVLLSVPLHFRYAHHTRTGINDKYFGDIEANCPLGLLKTARQKGMVDFLVPGFQLLILVGELDREDEILKTRDDFLIEWTRIDTTGSRLALSLGTMAGHNHISPFCSLGTNLATAETWGHQVAAFCNNIRAMGFA